MVSIARKNLFEDLPRFLVAQAGIMFAVGLVTIQTGILSGFTRSTIQLIETSPADIWVSSESMVHLDLTMQIPLQRLLKAREVQGVDVAEGLIIKGSLWRKPNGKIVPIRLIGFDPSAQLFTPANITQGSVSNLAKPYSVMIDETNLSSLQIEQLGTVVEIAGLPGQVAGMTRGNRAISSSAFVFTSLETANAYLTANLKSSLYCTFQSGSEEMRCTNTYQTLDPASEQSNPQTPVSVPNLSSVPPPPQLTASDLITYILIRAKPGEDLQALKQRLNAALPNTLAYTHAEMAEQTQAFWQKQTGIGFVLALGAAVGVIVGMVIVSQILYASVSDHLKEFGTLKAMGASDWFVYGVIIEQALWMAVLGYIPGIALCLGLGTWTAATQGILILITPVTAIAVFGLTVVMCISSAVFAIQRVTRLDPAIVFKA